MLQAQLRRQLKEERERHARQVAQLEARLADVSSESDQQLQQQLDRCQQEYEQKLQEIKVCMRSIAFDALQGNAVHLAVDAEQGKGREGPCCPLLTAHGLHSCFHLLTPNPSAASILHLSASGIPLIALI